MNNNPTEAYFGADVGDPHPASEVMDIPDVEMQMRERLGTVNFEGDWTIIFRQRLEHPSSFRKYVQSKYDLPTEEEKTSSYFESKKSGETVCLEKPRDVPRDTWVSMMHNYQKNIEEVFNATDYKKSSDTNRTPKNLGQSDGYGDRGTVFVDAKKDGKPLSDRHKNIIEAHEKAHGIFMGLTNGEKRRINYVFDYNKIGYGLDKTADEILARMSQLKNYFGFNGNQTFTLDHFRYARKHYVEDTGLDNNMKEFFGAIIPERENDFVDLMNTIAC